MLFLLYLQQVSSETCLSYSCSSEDLGPSTCAYLSNAHYSLDPCKDPLYSVCSLSTETYSECEKPRELAEGLKFPGEKCWQRSDCNDYAEYSCKSNVCKGFGTGDEDKDCTSSFQCSPGFYCKDQECKTQIAVGGRGCITDFDCVNNAACDGGVCVLYHSLGAGASINACNYGVNYACDSQLCTTDYFGNSFCLTKASRSSLSPLKCSEDSDCDSNPDPKYKVVQKTKCSCGYNPTGSKFCELLPGDEYFEKYLEELKLWRQSQYILSCNTLRRMAKECIKDWYPYENRINLMYYAETVRLWPKIQDTDYCAETILLREYLELKHQFEHI